MSVPVACKRLGHFWRGIGSTRDLREIKQVCQRCTLMRTVRTSDYKEKPNADSGIDGGNALNEVAQQTAEV